MRYRTTGEILDVLEVGAEALLFIDDKLIRGSVVSVDLLWLCTEPRTMDELVEHCRNAFGEPPVGTVEESTAAAVQALVAAEVLEALP